jgi:ubiquinol-cytochrome c reductase iron-sulfur subunit
MVTLIGMSFLQKEISMGDSSLNYGRRRFLTATTAVVGGVGVATASIPFIRSWNPTEKAKRANTPIEVDISKLDEGQMLRIQWGGRPVWIVRRSSAVLAELSFYPEKLKDPESIQAQQPDYARNIYRSIHPEFFVAVGICTHLGCSPVYRPNSLEEQEPGVKSGFVCPCHRSVFDMAGRVFHGGPAPYNLVVPRHMYVNQHKIIIGIDDVGEA